MKRSTRLIFALFAAALLVSAFSLRLALTVSAEDTVILTVTGYRINEPKRETMPYFSGSTLYVPVSMFTALGLTCTNQSTLVILSNLKSGRILYFDTASGTAAVVSAARLPLPGVLAGAFIKIIFFAHFLSQVISGQLRVKS